MRAVAEATRACGRVPDAAEVDAILTRGFFLPTANKVAHRQLRDAARRLVLAYADRHEDDLHRVWEAERPFELHLAIRVRARDCRPNPGQRCRCEVRTICGSAAR